METDRFDLDTNLMSEIQKSRVRRRKSQMRSREMQKQRMKRSGLMPSDTSSKTSNSHLVPSEYDKRDITPAMSSISGEEDRNKSSSYVD